MKGQDVSLGLAIKGILIFQQTQYLQVLSAYLQDIISQWIKMLPCKYLSRYLSK